MQNRQITSTDELVLLSFLSEVLPGSPPYKTLWRWQRYGLKSLTGKIVKLQCKRIPGGLGSSLKAYNQFVARLQK